MLLLDLRRQRCLQVLVLLVLCPQGRFIVISDTLRLGRSARFLSPIRCRKRSFVLYSRDQITIVFRSGQELATHRRSPPLLPCSLAPELPSPAIMRRLRGLLNRMSEQNIDSVTAEVAQLFGQSSQRLLAKALTASIMGSCLSEAQVLAPLVLLNAALLRGLSLRAHAAELVPRFVEDLVGELQRALDDGHREQAASNALLFVASLYNLGALHCKLLYELIGELVRRFGEIELSLLCLLLRSVGPQLRADDPAALRDIILQVQQQEAAQAVVGDGAPSQRMRVFVQMVYDLKNNRARKQEQVAADGALGRLQKWAKALEGSAQASNAPPFKVGWTELLEAGTRGRWWLVGSAWAGRKAEETRGAAEKKGSQRAKAEKLERLASSQRMNTDLRRGVFVAIMVSRTSSPNLNVHPITLTSTL